MVRLHLGCGGKILPGYTNIDAVDERADLVADVRTLPFPEDYADEILAVHVFEHFWLKDVQSILTEWRRVLKPGGRLILELPCLDKIARLITTHHRVAMNGLFGAPDTHRTVEDLHKWCWRSKDLAELLKQCGYREVEQKEPHYHIPARDMRMEAVK